MSLFPIFVTGNADKATYLSRFLGITLEHQAVNAEEIQSLDLLEVTKHKLRAAYSVIQKPVLVEDVSLEFEAFGRLPGTFIKHFIDEIGLEGLCRLLDGKSRKATARCAFGYTDGNQEKYFEGSAPVTIAQSPAGEFGYGWDKIAIHDGFAITRAQMTKEDNERMYLQVKPIEKVREFLLEIQP
jgi:non-canonical purine NTP pyrophosphatase (RdgB/HAM1 family)